MTRLEEGVLETYGEVGEAMVRVRRGRREKELRNLVEKEEEDKEAEYINAITTAIAIEHSTCEVEDYT
jgi:hypothetical protein